MQDLLSRLGTLDSKIGSLSLEKIARRTGFFRRSARKADARQWLRTICMLSALPARSYRTFGWLMGLIDGSSHSRQNIGKRMHVGFEHFLKDVLGQVVSNLVAPVKPVDPTFKSFGRVILQDSTIIGLPARMAKRFPGSANQSGKPIAGMRIQAFFDLLSESCLGFSTSPFIRNDQKASADILDLAQAGDLVVRDLGYSSLAVFHRLKQAGVHLLSRLKHGTCIFDQDGNQLNLLKRLQRAGSLDTLVYIGSEARLPIRLIAVPVPEAVAAERRRKARLNRDRRLNASEEKMRLLGWQILITTVPPSRLSSDQIVKLYALRWRIETLFKAWKSHFHFGAVPTHASVTFVYALVLGGLLYVAVFQCLFQTLRHRHTDDQSHLSPLKLASILQNLAAIELKAIIDDIPTDNLWELTSYHCRYDKRKRPNHFQIVEDLSLG
ncbi:MAG: IS4 family transposase [Puniceicoccaceae bacterium]|nr:MAG: IS4 family transposase [Puniceicoccaceae bacterium]